MYCGGLTWKPVKITKVFRLVKQTNKPVCDWSESLSSASIIAHSMNLPAVCIVNGKRSVQFTQSCLVLTESLLSVVSGTLVSIQQGLTLLPLKSIGNFTIEFNASKVRPVLSAFENPML